MIIESEFQIGRPHQNQTIFFKAALSVLSIGYWVDADDTEEWQRYGFGLTKLPGSLNRSEVLDLYARRSGWDISDPVFYYTYGLFKIAVIVQQIYFRYRQGITHDRRFADLGGLVGACGSLAQRAIEKGRIDRLG